MKILARSLVLLFIISIASNTYAQNWIAYQGYYQQPVITHSQIYAQPYVPVSQPLLIYQWVPYQTQQNIIVEQRCFLHKTYKIVTVPQTQWIYQPTIIPNIR
jgi:hypothetical protein